MKHLTKMAICVAALLASSLNVTAQEKEYNVYNGVTVGSLDPCYFAYSGPYKFDCEMTETSFNFPMGEDKVYEGGFGLIYSTEDHYFVLVPEGEFSNVIQTYLSDYLKKHPYAKLLSRIVLSNHEDFACPVEYYPDEQGISIEIADATYSSEIEEIGTESFNSWSTLKYLTSRLMKNEIIAIEFAGDDPDSEFTVLCNINVRSNSETVSIGEAILAIAIASEDFDFCSYSWDTSK